jgi:hypothetical protein
VKKDRAEGGKKTKHDFLRAVPVHYFTSYFKASGTHIAVFETLPLVCLILLNPLFVPVRGQQNLNSTQRRVNISLTNSTGANFPISLSPNATAGGVIIPTDKFALLIPYIGLSATILVSTVATGISIKRVKHRKEKQ